MSPDQAQIRRSRFRSCRARKEKPDRWPREPPRRLRFRERSTLADPAPHCRNACQQEPKSAPVSGTEKCTTRRSKSRPLEGWRRLLAQRAVGERSEMPPARRGGGGASSQPALGRAKRAADLAVRVCPRVATASRFRVMFAVRHARVVGAVAPCLSSGLVRRARAHLRSARQGLMV